MWGGGQAREMEELRPCVCRPVCPLCVCGCVCVCLGALWAVLVAVRLEGRGARTPPASPFTGRGALEGFDDAGSDGEAATPRTQGGETQGGETHTSMS